MIDILIKFPTRERKDRFFSTLDIYYNKLSNKHSFHFLISLDSDDTTMNTEEIKERLNKYKNLSYYYGDNKNKIEAINKDMDKTPCFFVLLLASDDMIPVENGYDDIIITQMKMNYPDGDGVLWFFDGHNANTNTLSIMGQKYYNKFNYIYHPSYKSLYCDNEFMDVANILKKQKYINKIIIEHQHHSVGYSDRCDGLYAKNDKYIDEDMRTYYNRKNINFGVGL